MKFKLFIIAAVIFLLLSLAIAAFPEGNAVAQAGNGPIRIEVSRFGFDYNPEEFRFEVEEGQEVVITFVYGDLPRQNPHRMFISGYNIQADILDRDNPEVTVRFIASRSGEVSFMCIQSCTGHENLQGGRILVRPTTKPPAEEAGGPLRLIAPEQAQSGQPLTLTVELRDSQNAPVRNALVKFLINVDFFVSGLMEIGDAMTNDQGIAVFEYTPRQTGDIQIVARYERGGLEAVETSTTISLADNTESLYQAEVGLRYPVPLPEVVIGPKSALEPGEGGAAPTTGLRIPGGLPSLLFLAYVFTVILVWSLYLTVMYQVLRISIVGEIGGTNTRLIPLIGMGVMLALVTLLVLVLITSPYSHPNVLR